jgi:L-alanine-DL-glutamate epimerase-like enolase superfamily enzyme
MQITAIETIQLDEFPNLFWVHVHTDEGLLGLGEAFFGPRAAVAYIHESAAPRLLGQDPLAIDRHSRTLLDTYVGFSGSGAEMRGLSALDIALWDIFGQATGQPIHQLLGGLSRPKIRVYNTCAGYRYVRQNVGQLTENWGLPAGQAAGPYEDLDAFLHRADELAHSLLEQGITGMKIWPFDEYAESSNGTRIAPADLKKALAPFEKIRRAVGDDMDIHVEFHSLWDLPTAIEIEEALAPYRPYWFEDPIKMTNLDALADYRRRTNVRVTSSERSEREGLPRAAREARGQRGHVRHRMVRRALGGAEDRGDGRSLRAAGRTSRLHRSDRAGGGRAPVAPLPERARPGDGPCVLLRLVPGAGDPAPAGREGVHRGPARPGPGH